MYRGSTKETRGTAYVVYEDIYDAKTAVEHLSGFNVANRYLIVLYYNHNKHSKKVGLVLSELLLLSSCALLLFCLSKSGLFSPACQHCLLLLQLSTKDKEEELLKMQEKYGVDAQQHPHKKAGT